MRARVKALSTTGTHMRAHICTSRFTMSCACHEICTSRALHLLRSLHLAVHKVFCLQRSLHIQGSPCAALPVGFATKTPNKNLRCQNEAFVRCFSQILKTWAKCPKFMIHRSCHEVKARYKPPPSPKRCTVHKICSEVKWLRSPAQP